MVTIAAGRNFYVEFAFHITTKTQFDQLEILSNAAVSLRIDHILNTWSRLLSRSFFTLCDVLCVRDSWLGFWIKMQSHFWYSCTFFFWTWPILTDMFKMLLIHWVVDAVSDRKHPKMGWAFSFSSLVSKEYAWNDENESINRQHVAYLVM